MHHLTVPATLRPLAGTSVNRCGVHQDNTEPVFTPFAHFSSAWALTSQGHQDKVIFSVVKSNTIHKAFYKQALKHFQELNESLGQEEQLKYENTETQKHVITNSQTHSTMVTRPAKAHQGSHGWFTSLCTLKETLWFFRHSWEGGGKANCSASKADKSDENTGSLANLDEATSPFSSVPVWALLMPMQRN